MKISLIDRCFSSHPVGFALVNAASGHFAAYYTPEGRLKVVFLNREGGLEQRAELPEVVGWDSHNSLSLAQDDDGCLHLSGNMHGDPLVYYRTRRAGDVTSFARVPAMTGHRENLVTYPRFFPGPGGQLFFTYRDGFSGQGDQVTNVYETHSRSWRHVGAGCLVAGENQRNAYVEGPVQGPDGFFHLCWTWREHYEAHTCRDICYARSRNLRDWEDSRGRALSLPITIRNAETVDAVPINHGIINGNVRLGFDLRGHPVVSYHKIDAEARNQIHNARPGPDGWTIRQTTHWEERWRPAGAGTLSFRFRMSGVRADASERLFQKVRFDDGSWQKWRLDPETLAQEDIVTDTAVPRDLPVSADLRRQWSPDLLDFPAYALTWESLPENHDQSREERHPGTDLHLVKVESV